MNLSAGGSIWLCNLHAKPIKLSHKCGNNEFSKHNYTAALVVTTLISIANDVEHISTISTLHGYVIFQLN